MPLLRLFAIALSVWFCIPFSARAEEAFEWKLKAGDVVDWTYENTTTTTATGPDGKEQTGEMMMKLYRHGVVEDAADGQFRLQVTTPRAAAKYAEPNGPPLDVDSEVEPKDEFSKGFGKIVLDGFLEVKYGVTIDRRGNAIKFDIDPELVKRMNMIRQSRPTVSTYTTLGFNSLAFGGWLGLPEGSIDPNKEWSLTLPVQAMDRDGIGQNYKQTVKYVGKEKLDTGEVDRFTTSLDVAMDERGEGTVKCFDGQKSSGFVLFDRRAGRMVQSEVIWEATPRLKIDLPIKQRLKIVAKTIVASPSGDPAETQRQ